jgi:hypothetical protein
MISNSLAIYENFAQTKEIANALSSSDLVPDHFKKKPANVLIALEFAHRNDISPFAAMQSLFVIHGRVGLTASMAISLARKHNVWKSLVYKVEGEGNTLAVTAIAKLHDDSEATATVTMKMANDAGWSKNAIYKSIPEQMLKYRAAVFLIRSHFPEVLFGMQTVEELRDVDAATAKNVTPPKKEEVFVTIDPELEEMREKVIALTDLHVTDEVTKSKLLHKTRTAKNFAELESVCKFVTAAYQQTSIDRVPQESET